jgi:hypothetical protein
VPPAGSQKALALCGPFGFWPLAAGVAAGATPVPWRYGGRRAKETAGDRPEGGATQLQTLGRNMGMAWLCVLVRAPPGSRLPLTGPSSQAAGCFPSPPRSVAIARVKPGPLVPRAAASYSLTYTGAARAAWEAVASRWCPISPPEPPAASSQQPAASSQQRGRDRGGREADAPRASLCLEGLTANKMSWRPVFPRAFG